MENKYLIVDVSDDHQALYRNGELVLSGHCLYPDEILEALGVEYHTRSWQFVDEEEIEGEWWNKIEDESGNLLKTWPWPEDWT